MLQNSQENKTFPNEPEIAGTYLSKSQIEFKSLDSSHVSEVIELVKNTPKLDDNSDYIYALWSTYFTEHSAVALRGDEVIAFLTGFRAGKHREKYFLWQTATKPRHGVPNLGIDLIHYAVSKEIENGARIIEASVDSENTAIILLMRALRKKIGGVLDTRILFPSDMLSSGSERHHDEILYTISI